MNFMIDDRYEAHTLTLIVHNGLKVKDEFLDKIKLCEKYIRQ